MSDNPQLERYKKLLTYIDDHLKDDIKMETVEEICHYSYRNINRIFEAIHQETIGKYIKRLRLEKAAQYLKYSSMGVSQIAYEVGFEDRAAFSKAFKKRYHASPKEFRASTLAILEESQKRLLPDGDEKREKLAFEIEFLPEFDYLFLEFQEDYQDMGAWEKQWHLLYQYATEKRLITEQSIFMTEIIDDAEISDHIHSRYRHALLLMEPLGFEPGGRFRVRTHKRQKYAKFTHQGDHQSGIDYYQQIFCFWMVDVGLELSDLPILEFYPNFGEPLPASELITEIYIPLA
ncbi:MAG: AraC family transcriptional regulator [Bacteroidota bacterium]